MHIEITVTENPITCTIGETGAGVQELELRHLRSVMEERVRGWFMFRERQTPKNALVYRAKLQLRPGECSASRLFFLVETLVEELNQQMFRSRNPRGERLIGLSKLTLGSTPSIELLLRAPALSAAAQVRFETLLLDTWHSLGASGARKAQVVKRRSAEDALQQFMLSITSRDCIEQIHPIG